MTNTVVVASYNVYLGADLSLVLGEQTGEEYDANLAEVQRQLLATAFDRRAPLVAAALAPTPEDAPDLVGLQEVCTWTLDGIVLWDFAALLLAALAERGVRYVVECSVETFGGTTRLAEGADISGMIQLSGANVVLRRADSRVRVARTRSGLYGEALGVSLDVDELAITRGWCAAACELDGQPFAFVNTHTEAYAADSRNHQRDELLTAVADWSGPLVVVGDFNAHPDAVGMPTEFVDAWEAGGAGPGWTCCQAPDLSDPVSRLDERIDYVWVRDAAVEQVTVAGVEPAADAPVWPSDHAAVVARVRLS